jgi:hypothetical protein
VLDDCPCDPSPSIRCYGRIMPILPYEVDTKGLRPGARAIPASRILFVR